MRAVDLNTVLVKGMAKGQQATLATAKTSA